MNSLETILWMLNVDLSQASIMQHDTHMMLGSGSKPQLSASHKIIRVNNQYTYNHSVLHFSV